MAVSAPLSGRRRRVVLIVLGLLLSVTVAVFVVLPRLIVWQISTRLPLSVVFPAGRIEVSVVSTVIAPRPKTS